MYMKEEHPPSPRFVEKRPQPSPDVAAGGKQKRAKPADGAPSGGGIVNQVLNADAVRLKHVADNLRNSEDVRHTSGLAPTLLLMMTLRCRPTRAQSQNCTSTRVSSFWSAATFPRLVYLHMRCRARRLIPTLGRAASGQVADGCCDVQADGAFHRELRPLLCEQRLVDTCGIMVRLSFISLLHRLTGLHTVTNHQQYRMPARLRRALGV